MFGYLRLFSIISLIVVVILAALVGMYYRALSGEDLRALATHANRALANSFIESVWKPHRSVMLSAMAEQNTQARTAAFNEFEKSADTFFGATAPYSVTLYDPAGNAIYNFGNESEDFSVRELSALNRDSLDSDSRLVEQPEHGTGDAKTRYLLQTPFIVSTGTRPEAYLKISADISPQWHRLMLLQWVASGGIVTIFLILMWILILTSSKAEAIITRQHEANVELAAQAAAAQAESREKSLFLANISHELRTPLNAIIGFSEIIKNELMGEITNQRYQDYIKDIHNSGVHLLSLINDILDFSKAEAGKLELEISEVNATKLVLNCLRLVSPRAEVSNVTLSETMPKEQFVMVTDSKKFKQVLLNLLSNAVKFTPSGGEVRVTAWHNVTDDSYSFEVRDTGIGIAPKDLSRAMAPFGQVDNALSRKYEGTGLGLPLTKKFVELMGGRFMIESQVNTGTVVTFTLPREFRSNGEVPYRMLS